MRLIFLYILGFPKTLWVNFKLFPFLKAIKLPIIVSHKTRFQSLSGKVIMDTYKFATWKIGFGSTPTTNFRSDHPILNIQGLVRLHGKCRMGIGSKIHVHGTLEIGDNFNMTGNSTIVCAKHISMGNHVLISWNVLMMDTDQHAIMNLDGTIINHDKDIIIESDVWICSGVSILKGVRIANNIVIGANSLVNKPLLESNAIYVGNPARLAKQGIKWN